MSDVCRRLSAAICLVAGPLVCLAGCGAPPSASPVPVVEAEKTKPVPARPAKAASEETFFANYLAGAKLGHIRLARRVIAERGRELSEWTIDMQLSIVRDQQTSDVRIRFVSRETLDGKLLSFEGEQPFGPAHLLVRGEVVGRELQIETSGNNRLDRQRIAWKEGTGGFQAIEQSLAAKPMEPGEKRSLEKLEPIIFQVVPVKLEAKSLESTRLLDGQRELLRIETVTTLPNNIEQQQTLWCDQQGQIYKIHSAADRTEAFRCSREEALAPATGARIDLLLDALVKLPGPLAGAHDAPLLSYVIRLPDADPSQIFAKSGSQQVAKIDEHSARITVARVRPGDAPPAGFGNEEPAATKEESAASAFIQIDDPAVQELAQAAAPDEKDPWKLAVALEKFIHEKIDRKDFSQAFATAADVAKALRGDCTEHAVLLAALCRARGIPARISIGLVYLSQPQPAFGFHMWNEVYIDQRWIPIDATLGRGGIGAAHIKLAHTALSEGASLVSFLPVAQVLGRLEIKVEDPPAAPAAK